jgi:hypothetical protein
MAPACSDGNQKRYPRSQYLENGSWAGSGWEHCDDPGTLDTEPCRVVHADGWDKPECGGWDNAIGGFDNSDCNMGSAACPDQEGQDSSMWTCAKINSWGGPLTTLIDESPVAAADVQSFTLNHPDGSSETLMPWYAEKGNYSNLSWDTARNGFRASGWREYSDLYSYHGAGLLPVDIYEVIVNLTGGSSLPAIPVAVKSNRVMPVVDTLTHYTDLVAVDDKKKGK